MSSSRDDENVAICASALLSISQQNSQTGEKRKRCDEDRVLETLKQSCKSKQPLKLSVRYADPRLQHIVSSMKTVKERQNREEAFICEETPMLMKQKNLVSMRFTCGNRVAFEDETGTQKIVQRSDRRRENKCHGAKCIYLNLQGDVTGTSRKLDSEHRLCARCRDLQPSPLPPTACLTSTRVSEARERILNAGYDPKPRAVRLIANVKGAQ